jgi:site-specific recombinase XerC
MKIFKKIMPIGLALVLSLGSMVNVFAYPLDNVNYDGIQVNDTFYSLDYIIDNEGTFGDLFGPSDSTKVILDFNQKAAKFSDYLTANPADFDAWASAPANQTPANPAKLVKNVKFDKYIRKALTEDEFEKLKYACKTPREHALVSVFYSTAARVSEICALNKDDIDWYNDTIKVFGKGRKERYVYLNANAKLFLSKYLESRTDAECALFVGCRSPYGRLSCRAIEDDFHDLGKRAGIASRVYPHLLRHTMSTNWLRTGGDIAEVSKILGHSNISTTQIYAQVNNDNIKSSFKKHML